MLGSRGVGARVRRWGRPVASVLIVGAGVGTMSSAVASGVTTAGAAGRKVVVSTDLPLQGESSGASTSTNNAVALYLSQVRGRAGRHTVTLRSYDDSSTAAAGVWSAERCVGNARAHVAAADEVAVVGPYNSGCARVQAPILSGAGLVMVSHSTSYPGLTKPWLPGEPGKYSPGGRRAFARVSPTDDLQGTAAAVYAKKLKVRRVFVLDDGELYGLEMADAFTRAAKANGITVVGSASWDPRAAGYAALFRTARSKRPDAVYLGGVFDSNGGRLVTDKVSVLGNNTQVKLLASEGFTGYPAFNAMPQAQGAYLTYPGVPLSVLKARGGAPARFLAAYRARYGAEPDTSYALYGAAALQVVLAAVAKSDGSRAGVRAAIFSGKGITIPASASLLGAAFTIDPRTGDVSLKETTVETISRGVEQYVTVVHTR